MLSQTRKASETRTQKSKWRAISFPSSTYSRTQWNTPRLSPRQMVTPRNPSHAVKFSLPPHPPHPSSNTQREKKKKGVFCSKPKAGELLGLTHHGPLSLPDSPARWWWRWWGIPRRAATERTPPSSSLPLSGGINDAKREVNCRRRWRTALGKNEHAHTHTKKKIKKKGQVKYVCRN